MHNSNSNAALITQVSEIDSYRNGVRSGIDARDHTARFPECYSFHGQR